MNENEHDKIWRHLSLDEYSQYISLFDNCPCGASAIGLYFNMQDESFRIYCTKCCNEVVEKRYANAMVIWNKRCRK